jgi:hypothetical protein
LLFSAVYEDCVWCKAVVVVDDVAEVYACFVTFSGIWNEEFVIGVLV